MDFGHDFGHDFEDTTGAQKFRPLHSDEKYPD
jgi:hypothetical protein